jgi:hypothetical protein
MPLPEWLVLAILSQQPARLRGHANPDEYPVREKGRAIPTV